MEINQLRYLVKVMELKSFSKASAELFITQPTLSQQISKLEEEFKVKLINRTTRSFSITEAGEAFFQEAKKIVEESEKLTQTMAEYVEKKRGALRVGLFPTYAKIGKAKQIAKFSEQYPEVKLEFVENFSEDLYQSLLSEKIDLAILNKIAVKDDKAIKRLAFFPIVNDRLAVICSKDNALSKYPSVSLAEAIQNHVYYLPEKTSATKTLKRELVKKRLLPKEYTECESTQELLYKVDLDEGIAFMSEITAKTHAENDIKIVRLVPKIPYTSAICTLKKNLNSPHIQSFIDFLTNQKK